MKHKNSNEKSQTNCKNESFYHVLFKLSISVNCFGSPIHQQLVTLCFVVFNRD